MSGDADTNNPTRPRVVLGVSGGVACYKSCTVARRLTEAGVAVDVVLTKSATEFIRPPLFEALTGRAVVTSLWERGRALDHLYIPQQSNLIVLAPATANLIARAAQGMADDFLTTLLLATDTPVLVAPAMNDRMWDHPATRANMRMLEERGWRTIGPMVGPLAEGPSQRPGRMAEPEAIVVEALRLLRQPGSRWDGKRVLVTAGATREGIDPVRIISNRASGKMGFAIAEAAYARGADVVLISGPTSLDDPWGVSVERVESTDQMLEAVRRHIQEADVVVMAAAPADYRPQSASRDKLTRNGGSISLALEPTPDILLETRSSRKRPAVIVGFSLETHDGISRAREKLARKELDLIALNTVDDTHTPFESSDNRLTIISDRIMKETALQSKRQVGEELLDVVETLF